MNQELCYQDEPSPDLPTSRSHRLTTAVCQQAFPQSPQGLKRG